MWFLVFLHFCENTILLLVSKWVYIGGYPLGLLLLHVSLLSLNNALLVFYLYKKQTMQVSHFDWFYLVLLVPFNLVAVFLPKLFSDSLSPALLAIDLSIVALNILGVATAYFYTKKFELYADIQHLPHTLPDLPSYGPEVKNSMKEETSSPASCPPFTGSTYWAYGGKSLLSSTRGHQSPQRGK